VFCFLFRIGGVVKGERRDNQQSTTLAMLPRLQPRPRRSGIENAFPNNDFDVGSNPQQYDNDDDNNTSRPTTYILSSAQNHSLPLSDKTSASSLENVHLSPSSLAAGICSDVNTNDDDYSSAAAVQTPVSVHHGQHHRYLLSLSSPFSSSSSSSSFDADTSTCSDFSLTPPVAKSQPLVVANKRFSSELRRQHSKKRRRRRRRQHQEQQQSSSEDDIPQQRMSYDDEDDDDDDDYFGWKDDNDRPSSLVDSSSGEDEDEGLPFLFDKGELSPSEMNKKYWEWCYGKGETVELPLDLGGFSSKRNPPTKGW
jgi:hypothetical protein